MKLVGIMLVLFMIINYFLFIFIIKIGDINWSFNFIIIIVEEGIILILGIVLMFCVYGFEEIFGLVLL